MTLPPRPAPGEQACAQCAAPLAADQHWCVVCGARQAGARTDALALLFAERRAAEAAAQAAAGADAGAGAPGGAGASTGAPSRPLDAARRRRAAAPAALAALVGLFVVSGTSVSALAGSSQPPFTVVLPAQVAQQIAQAPPAPAPVVEAPVVEAPADDVVVSDAPVAETPVAETPVEETPSSDDETPAAEVPADSSPIRHVFLVVLGSTDVAALAQDETAAPYLAGTLAKSGTLLSDYTTVARGALANRIALVSGQGPTQQTLADCTTYGDVTPAEPLDAGQTGGDGCVYGFETGHVGDQLRALERTWKAYTEPAAGASSGPRAHAAAACRPDATTTRRNPFLWFHGTFEADDCDERNVPLSQLAEDLRDAETTPALSWIASDAQQGSADADAFLERVVPQIQNSLAYADGGLIVITSDQPAPAAAPPPDPTTTTPTPTTPTPPPTATDPAAPPTTTAPATPPPATTTTAPATPTTPSDPPPTTTTPTTTTQTTPTTTTPGLAPPTPQLAPGPTRYPNVGGALTAGGGQRVGALLISPFTPSGRVDATPANAYTLLRTLEQIFGADPLGYAADNAIRPLPDTLFSVTP